MPAKVTLTVDKGNLTQGEYVFDDRTTCIIGRASDCHPRIPTDEHHLRISRHHCLLDINPPDIRVRDFGSLNGTFVNEKKIGQREKGMTAEEAAELEFPEHDLKDGDRIRLSKTIFRVSVHVPATCAECSAEIRDSDKAKLERTPGVYQCAACHAKAKRAGLKKPLKRKPPVCAKCGRDVAGEVGEGRRGEYVCVSCQAEPLKLLKALLDQARSGRRELAAIERYSIVKELGKGGMGAVYLAKQDGTGKHVALKIMLPRVAADKRATEMFLREVENTKALDHPHVVKLHDDGCSNGTFFFTMEYCDGGSVDHLMQRRGGTLAVDEAGPIILQVLKGLEYAHHATIPFVKLPDGTYGHGEGVVHRDLNPRNIFLRGSDGSSIAKIGDFGLAKAFDTAGLSGLTRTGTAAGKPWFMPRQQAINYKYAKPDVDVWAVAATFYNMLTGQYPLDFPKDKDVWQCVLSGKPVPIRKRGRRIPRDLAKVIDEALVCRPRIGFPSAAAFRRALEKVL